MSTEDIKNQSFERRKQLARLRQQLEALVGQQTGVTNLLLDLAEINTATTSLEEGDEEMLALILSDVLQGKDIKQQHPDFYQKFIAHAELREHFLDLWKATEEMETGTLESLPRPPAAAKLPWLAQPTVEHLANNRWRVTIQRTKRQLQNMFEAATVTEPKLAFRTHGVFLDDIFIDLFHRDITVAGVKLSVFLQAKQPLLDPKNLTLDLWLHGVSTAYLPKLDANLRWGNYNETVSVPNSGHTQFPKLPLTAVFNTTETEVTAELNFILSTT